MVLSQDRGWRDGLAVYVCKRPELGSSTRIQELTTVAYHCNSRGSGTLFWSPGAFQNMGTWVFPLRSSLRAVSRMQWSQSLPGMAEKTGRKWNQNLWTSLQKYLLWQKPSKTGQSKGAVGSGESWVLLFVWSTGRMLTSVFTYKWQWFGWLGSDYAGERIIIERGWRDRVHWYSSKAKGSF